MKTVCFFDEKITKNRGLGVLQWVMSTYSPTRHLFRVNAHLYPFVR